VGVGEVGDWLKKKEHGREGFNMDRSVQIEIVPILEKPIQERADGKQTEVRIDGEQIDYVAHLAEHNGSKRHQNDETEDERHPAHLHEVRLLDRLHADVMIESINLIQVLAMQPAALDFVGEDIKIEPIGILRCDEVHFPKRKEQRDADRHGCCKKQQA